MKISRPKKGLETRLQPFPAIGVFQNAGPDGDDVPAEGEEVRFVAAVTGAVAHDFGSPPIAAGGGESEIGTMFVAVPVAAVDEDDGAEFRKDQIGSAGEGFVFRAGNGETVAVGMKERPEGKLGPGVATADAGHDLRALFRGEHVHL